KIMALSLKYLVEKRGWTGSVVRTVSTTRMIDRLAKRYGLPLHETPVGFNHIADYMMSEDVLIGGEESGCISLRVHIPDGDGPIMGLLLVEMIAASGKTLNGLVEDLLKDVGPAFYERVDLRLNRPVAKTEMTEYLMRHAPAEIGGEKVCDISQRDGVKYIMLDDSWLLIRPSGTEPVLRVYAEGRTQEMVKALLGYGEHVAKSVV
ncbi:MAG TPA: phosphoglucomutase/phosphomannomutase family protein, partial [Anaerolineales bacterium]|nr:phosphoglucomutase/phosphomannomutase family protein [Anaerolineales bacterium]